MAEVVGTEAARPRSEWHEDHGPVLWWFFPIQEPPYVGTPNDSEWPLQYDDDVDDPGEGFDLCTHWTPIPIPPKPWPSSEGGASNG